MKRKVQELQGHLSYLSPPEASSKSARKSTDSTTSQPHAGYPHPGPLTDYQAQQFAYQPLTSQPHAGYPYPHPHPHPRTLTTSQPRAGYPHPHPHPHHCSEDEVEDEGVVALKMPLKTKWSPRWATWGLLPISVLQQAVHQLDPVKYNMLHTSGWTKPELIEEFNTWGIEPSTRLPTFNTYVEFLECASALRPAKAEQLTAQAPQLTKEDMEKTVEQLAAQLENIEQQVAGVMALMKK